MITYKNPLKNLKTTSNQKYFTKLEIKVIKNATIKVGRITVFLPYKVEI